MDDSRSHHTGAVPATSPVRFVVLGMLCILAFILYLDRVCIGQAVGDIKAELGLSDSQMGVVLAAFTLAYGLFEIPTGHWGDRDGSRSVLTRIVVWWSLFTMLTGAATGFASLVAVRFLFGAGEAGALPNAARVVARWFPAGRLGPAQSAVVTSALIGGTLAPMLAQPLIAWLGWRWTFVVLGFPGLAWAAVFYVWFRDDPAEHPWVAPQVREQLRRAPQAHTPAMPTRIVPWQLVLTSSNVWLLGAIVTCASATTYMMFSWYPTYLKEGRSVDPALAANLAALVLAGGAVGSTTGGWFGDWLVHVTGDRRWTRRVMGMVTLGSAGLAMMASVHCDSPTMASLCCAWACCAIHMQLAPWWGVITEISGGHLGALFGLMNSMGIPGAVASQMLLGRGVDWLGNHGRSGRLQWDPAFYIYGGVLLVGALLWLWVDAHQSAVEPRTRAKAKDHSTCHAS